MFVSNWKKIIFFSILSLVFTSCMSDNQITPTGSMSLTSLDADTTSLHIGNNGKVTRTSLSDELSSFLDVSDYTVQILDEAEKVVDEYKRYESMPSTIELPEGSFILKAFKGSDKAASFESPYFEGRTSFVVRDQMNTSVGVTCKLANARVTIESTPDFDKIYSDYIVDFSTDYIEEEDSVNGSFAVSKGEERPLYLRTGQDGTDVGITVYVKKPGETEFTAFYVSDPLKLEPRQSVRVLLSLSETNQGIGIDIMLDDTLTKLSITTEIPDYMWGQMGKPDVSAGFENGSTFLVDGLFDEDVNVSYAMSGGVSSLVIEYWRDGEEGFKTQLDLANASDVETALSYNLSWTANDDENVVLNEQVRSGEIYFKEALNSFPTPDEGEYLYHIQVYGKDATGKGFTTDTISFEARVLPAGTPVITDGGLPAEITEGDEMTSEVVFNYRASGGIDDQNTFLDIQVDQNLQHFLIADDGACNELSALYGIQIEKQNDRLAVVTFPKDFTTRLAAPETGSTTYTFAFRMKDKKGNEAKPVEHSLVVNAPAFTLDITEGHAFAKRIYLVGDLLKGDPKNLTFLCNGQSVSPEVQVQNNRYEAILTGLDPETSYTLQAIYNGKDNRKSEERRVTTEAILDIPNKGFEEWSIVPDEQGNADQGNMEDLPILTNYSNPPYRSWELYEVFNSELSMGWNTLNRLTTQDGTLFTKGTDTNRTWTRYVANSGTIPTNGYNSETAALIRTVGWGSGNSAAAISGMGDVAHITPGELYLGDYDSKANYGIDFESRPTAFSFDYKYERKNSDRFIAELVVMDDDKIIAVARLAEEEAVPSGSWISKKVYLDYHGEYGFSKANKMYIRFVSGTSDSKDDLMVYPPARNLSFGEYVGSQLYIDNVELIYE